MKETIVILDNIRSALNVGAIFRTCDGAGVSKLYLCGITPYPFHEKLHKTALGAEEYVNWKYFKDTLEAIREAKNEDFEVIAVEQTGEAKNYFEIETSEKCAFVFGNEITGVGTQALSLCDKHIILPMRGKKNSLNVATTAGIIAYHFNVELNDKK